MRGQPAVTTSTLLASQQGTMFLQVGEMPDLNPGLQIVSLIFVAMSGALPLGCGSFISLLLQNQEFMRPKNEDL